MNIVMIILISATGFFKAYDEQSKTPFHDIVVDENPTAKKKNQDNEVILYKFIFHHSFMYQFCLPGLV